MYKRLDWFSPRRKPFLTLTDLSNFRLEVDDLLKSFACCVLARKHHLHLKQNGIYNQ